jgi:hypothetical protein
MPSVLSTLRASEGCLTFLEKKRKAELKRVGTRDVPILFWIEVTQQGAEEEDTGRTYIYVPVSIAPGAEANDLGRKDICSVKIQKFQGIPQNSIAAGGRRCRSCSPQGTAMTS